MLTWGGPSTGVLKVIKLIVPFCVGECSAQRGTRLGLMLSSMHEGTSGQPREEQALYSVCQVEFRFSSSGV